MTTQSPERALVPLEPFRALSLTQVLTVGQQLAASGFFSDVKQPAQAVAKILYGQEIGIGPMSSMKGVYIIEGAPALAAPLMATLIKRHPDYDYRVRRLEDDGCTIDFYEHGELVGTVSFTKDDAIQAQLFGKRGDMYKKYPKNMYFSRALANGARWYCAGVFGGSPVYTPEELGSQVDEDGAPIGDITVTGGSTPEEEQRRQQGRFFGRAKDLGYTTHRLIHDAMGVAPEKGALAEKVQNEYGGDWAKALDVLEAKGPYQGPPPTDPMPQSAAIPPNVDVKTGEILEGHTSDSSTTSEAPKSEAGELEYLGVCSEEECRLPATGRGPGGRMLCEPHLKAVESATPDESGPGAEPSVCIVPGCGGDIASYGPEGEPLCAVHREQLDWEAAHPMPPDIGNAGQFLDRRSPLTG